MGKGSAEIAADNERRRHALTARVARLERRLQDDYDDMGEEITGRITRVTEGVKAKTTAVREAAAAVATTEAGSGSAVAEHPKVLVGAAAAAGFAVGAARGGDDATEDDHREAEHHEPGLARKAATKASLGVAGFLQAELASVARDFVKGAWEGHSGERHAPEPMTPARRTKLRGLEPEVWRPEAVEAS